SYRKVVGIGVPRSVERLGGHVQLLATELEAVVRGARADVLGFALDEAVGGGSGDITDRSSIFAAAERRRLASRFSAELTAKLWYDDLRIIGIADGGREIVRVNRSGAGGAIRAVTDAELQYDGDRDYFEKTITLAAGDVYISPVELRQNQGAVENPHVPIMRVAAPVFAPRWSAAWNCDRQARPAAGVRSHSRGRTPGRPYLRRKRFGRLPPPSGSKSRVRLSARFAGARAGRVSRSHGTAAERRYGTSCHR